MPERGQPADRTGNARPHHHSGGEAERRHAEDHKVEREYGSAERHDRRQTDSGLVERLSRHERRDDGDVERYEDVLNPTLVEARADERVMAQPEGGEDR